MDKTTKTDHTARRAMIAKAKAEIAVAQSAIAQLRAHGAHPKHSIEGAERDLDIARQEVHICEAKLAVERLRSELPPVQA